MVPHTLYGIGMWWSPLPYMEQVSYAPTCMCGPPLPYMEQVLCPPHVSMVPPHVQYDF